jgi:hypothetical protein
MQTTLNECPVTVFPQQTGLKFASRLMVCDSEMIPNSLICPI